MGGVGDESVDDEREDVVFNVICLCYCCVGVNEC